MSVVVKSMRMPESCWECRFSVDYWCYAKSAHGVPGLTFMDHRPDWCPLRPLPEKHGRLINADDFSAVMKERQLASAKWLREAKDAETINRADAVFAVLCEVKLTIGKLPTIVEAEGERDG